RTEHRRRSAEERSGYVKLCEVRRLLLNIPDFRNISQQFFQQTGVVHAQPIRPLQEQRKQDVRLDLKR
ncbi:MAG TPA: hypothetical protein PKC35_15925, partial [Leptospiraceae bacterium]|nr:hypothetical protein [Leptospiraceae bacterium]